MRAKKWQKFGCLVLSASFAMGLSACGPKQSIEIDTTKSQLWVSTRDAGIGTQWLGLLARGFEAKYANVSFEKDKVGVQVIDEAVRDNTGEGLMSGLKNSNYNVLMAEAFNYSDFTGSNLLYNLNDVVNKNLDDDSGTIVSKLDDNHKAYLTGMDGNYYALPWISGFNGVTYDAALFESKGFYFADENGDKPYGLSTYTDAVYTGRGFITEDNLKKSCGPDGEYETEDDGLPSSFEEFFYLLDYMVESKVTPFIYPGGTSAHYIEYLMQSLLLNYSGVEETSYNFSFNSGEKTAKIITSFDDDGEPVIEDKQITNDTGYLMSQQAGKYYVLKFLQKLYAKESDYFYSDTFLGAMTNLDAQTYFIYSNLDKSYRPIAMLIEGNYWYNEATTALQTSINDYGVKAENRNFRFMSLPVQELGTVEEGAGRAVGLADGLSCYFVINNNIKNDPVKVDLATKFLQYCYEDASLQQFTMSSGMPAAVKYNLTKDQYNSMPAYKQSIWSAYSAARTKGTYLSPVSGNRIFLNNYWTLGFSGSSSFFHTKINKVKQAVPRDVFNMKQNGKYLTAKDYFLGMEMKTSVWNEDYNVF